MYGLALPRARRRPVRRLFGGAALVVCVCVLFGMVSVAQQPIGSPTDLPFVTMERPTTQAPHAYFDALAARPDRLAAYSLRSQAQLDSLVKLSPSVFWKYAYGTDTHPLKQEGAKLFKPPRATFDKYPQLATYGTSGDENVPGNQVLRIPLGITSGSMLITWDVWWGEEFQTNKGPVLNAWKTFFLHTGTGITGTKNYWTLKDHVKDKGVTPENGEVSRQGNELNTYDSLGMPAGQVQNGDIFQHTGLGALPPWTYPVMVNRWTRYWLKIRMNVPGSEFPEWSQAYLSGAPLAGTWDMVSLWIAGENSDPVRVVHRVPVPRVDPMFSLFRLTWDTSTHNLDGEGLTGPVIAYARNVVILHNAGVEPISGSTPRSPRNVRIVG